jgi:aminopeptidase N
MSRHEGLPWEGYYKDITKMPADTAQVVDTVPAASDSPQMRTAASVTSAVWIAFASMTLVSSAGADTYPRQAGVDAWHYAFHLTISDTSPEISGEATVDLRLTRDGLDLVTLDFASVANGKGMTVTSVTSEGQPVRFVHEGQSLKLPLAGTPAAGQHVRFTIAYHGVPGGGLRLMQNKHGEWCAFSENWPDHARDWLPMIDHPYDKATSEFFITAPSAYQVIANGLLQREVDLGDGRRLTHWKQSIPMASWLNAVGIERFAVRYLGRVKDVELQTWVAHQDEEVGRAYFEVPARQALEFFSERIGPYPYEKLANVAAAGLSGATEHTSAIFYDERALKASPAQGLVAHETAHQWFGNAVTEWDWDEVWLSEGFATYFTLLYIEHYAGADTFIAELKSSRARALAAEKRLPGVSVIHNNLSDMSKVLNQLVYQKGGWVLHMLRGIIGTDTFWSGIREYYRQYRDGNASTADFRRVMEETSGTDLGWFFDQWLHRPASPSFDGGWRYNAAAKQIEIELTQTQAGDAYRVPVQVGVETKVAAQGEPAAMMRVERMQMTAKHQTFTIPSDAAPADVVFDPETWLLVDQVRFVKRP